MFPAAPAVEMQNVSRISGISVNWIGRAEALPPVLWWNFIYINYSTSHLIVTFLCWKYHFLVWNWLF